MSWMLCICILNTIHGINESWLNVNNTFLQWLKTFIKCSMQFHNCHTGQLSWVILASALESKPGGHLEVDTSRNGLRNTFFYIYNGEQRFQITNLSVIKHLCVSTKPRPELSGCLTIFLTKSWLIREHWKHSWSYTIWLVS